jgi:hypothetical protein
VLALHRPISAASIVFVMVSVTISVSIGRLILNGFTMNDTFYSTNMTIPLQLLAELETFFAAIVSCLPGLRVLLRKHQEENEVYNTRENTVVAVPEIDPEMEELGDESR